TRPSKVFIKTSTVELPTMTASNQSSGERSPHSGTPERTSAAARRRLICGVALAVVIGAVLAFKSLIPDRAVPLRQEPAPAGSGLEPRTTPVPEQTANQLAPSIPALAAASK